MSNPVIRNRHRAERSSLFGDHEINGKSDDAANGAGGAPGTATPAPQRRTRARHASALKAPPKPSGAQEASSIVESLLRTKSAMKQDLERLSYVTDAIDSDGAMLKDTQESHLGLGGLAKGARGALRYLQAQERRETVVLWAAVVFFYLSALYVFWTRVRIPFLLW